MVRVLFGFVLACLAAGVVTVSFADIEELKTLSADDAQFLLATTGGRVLSAAVQGAIFAALPAFVGIIIGEWRRIQSWTYYTLLALAITFLGFLAWMASEGVNDLTIVNNYALTAFLTTGFVAGLVYWLFSGRAAGTPIARSSYDFVNTPAENARQNGQAAKNGTGPVARDREAKAAAGSVAGKPAAVSKPGDRDEGGSGDKAAGEKKGSRDTKFDRALEERPGDSKSGDSRPEKPSPLAKPSPNPLASASDSAKSDSAAAAKSAEPEKTVPLDPKETGARSATSVPQTSATPKKD